MGDGDELATTLEATVHDGTTILRQGQSFARYRIEGLLGQGGMGQVYAAYDPVLRRRVALKVLRSTPAAEDDRDAHEEASSRILREARAAAALGHRGAVGIFDVGEHEGVPFIAMEWVNGRSLRAFVGDPRVPLDQRVRWLAEVARVLAAAHAVGLVHRDIKPENIMACVDGSIKVLDFGIARRTLAGETAPLQHAPDSKGGGPLSFRTADGRLRGTPRYMAPERFQGEALDARSDQFAWGVVAYELLAGTHPALHQSSAYPMLVEVPKLLNETAPGVPFELAAAVMKALAPTPSMRHADMETVASAIEPFAAALPGRASQAELASDPSGPNRVDPAAPTRSLRPSAPEPRSTSWWDRYAAALVLGVVFVVVGAASWRELRPKPSVAPVVTAPTTHAAALPLGPPLVLILGFDNRTTDPVLDGTMDLVLESSLTRSPTIYPLAGPSARALVTELAPEAAGNDLATGITLSERTHQRVVIIRGSVAQEASGFGVTLTVVEGSSGGSIGSPSSRAEGLERVVPTVARLGCAVRAALDDAPCEPGTEERSGMSASLEADQEYATGRGAYISGKFDEAVPHLQRAVDLDPTFALGRFRLGLVRYAMELHSEGQAQIQRAFAQRGNVSDREGLYMEAQGDLVLDEYRSAIPAYEKILERWPLDTRVPADLAIAYQENGDAQRAVEIGKRAAAEHPQNVITRSNLPGYYLAAGDIEHGESEARAVLGAFPNPPPFLHSYVGIARALAGDRKAAAESYRQVATLDPSEGAIAEGDFLMFDGRDKDAIALLEAGIASDEARKSPEDARAKWALLGEAWLEQGDLGRASDAATHAAGSVETTTLLCAGRVLAAAGHPDRAAQVARKIAAHPGRRAPLFSRVVDMDILVARGASTDAIVRTLGDIGSGPGSWLGRADLGAAYLARGAFEDAIRELEVCASHEGAGAKAFFDRPTLRYVQRARKLLARAKEGAPR